MLGRKVIINLTGSFLSCHQASREIKDIIYKNTLINSKFKTLNNDSIKEYINDSLSVKNIFKNIIINL